MTTENENAKPARMIRVKCLKNFNLGGLSGMYLAGTEQEITEQQVEFLQEMGLTNQPFIQIIDPDYNKPAPEAKPTGTPMTWTQTHGGNRDGTGVMAGLNAPQSAAGALDHPSKDAVPAKETSEVPGTEKPEGDGVPAKEPAKRSLNLKPKK